VGRSDAGGIGASNRRGFASGRRTIVFAKSRERQACTAALPRKDAYAQPVFTALDGPFDEASVGFAGSESDGLAQRSAASFDNLRHLPTGSLTAKLGDATPARRAQICRALSALADC